MRAECASTDAFRSEVVAVIREHWLSNLAHSLSSPLSAARGYIRMIQSGCAHFSDTDQRYLTKALDNLDKLVPLVRSLESYADVQDLDFTSFQVGDLLEEVLEKMRPSLIGQNMELRKSLRTESAATIGDRVKLSAALKDFLAAAAGFAIPDGVLDISASERDGRFAMQLNADSAHSCSATQPDLTAAARLWRLHGGRFSAGPTGNGYSLTCELPLIDFLRQQMPLSKED